MIGFVLIFIESIDVVVVVYIDLVLNASLLE